MPKTNTIYARLTLKSYDSYVNLNESRYEINERLYEVLNDEHYARKLTDILQERYPEKLAPWLAYKETYKKPSDYKDVHCVAKFHVTGQEVTFIDARFE